MPYTTVVAGTTITASWANLNVRNQVVTPFASAAARTSAVPSPIAGMVSTITGAPVHADMYDGSQWIPISPSIVGWNDRTTNVTATGAETLFSSVTFTSLGASMNYRCLWYTTWSETAPGEDITLRMRWAAGATVTTSGALLYTDIFTSITASYRQSEALDRLVYGLSAGTVTVGIFALVTFGSGTLTSQGSATNPATLYVECKGY